MLFFFPFQTDKIAIYDENSENILFFFFFFLRDVNELEVYFQSLCSSFKCNKIVTKSNKFVRYFVVSFTDSCNVISTNLLRNLSIRIIIIIIEYFCIGWRSSSVQCQYRKFQSFLSLFTSFFSSIYLSLLLPLLCTFSTIFFFAVHIALWMTCYI